MVTEDYISFEIATLLKKKEFDEKCQKVYMHNGQLLWAQIFMEGESFVNNECIDLVAKYNNWTEGDYAFLCPTLQMAMKWLREVHNIVIVATPSIFWGKYNIIMYRKGNDYPIGFDGDSLFPSYEQACEAAIKYCLEHLVK